MKKVTSLILMLLCIPLIMAGCVKTKASDKPLSFSFDKNQYYTGFSDLPSKLTLEKAKEDGYFVVKDGKSYANKELWTKFTKASSQKKNVNLRIVYFDKYTKGPSYCDLYYKDGYYYLFHSTKKDEQKESFSYLLTLEGRYPNAAVDETYIVLNNDCTLTFEKFALADMSSSRKTKESILPIRCIMHWIHDDKK